MTPEIHDMTPTELDAAIAREVTLVFRPSDRISDAFAAEEEIERRGMSAAYAENLIKIAWRGKSGRSTWYLIHASPLDRCRAMLETVRSAKEGKPNV